MTNDGLPEPVAYARAWFIAGEMPEKEANANGRLAWPAKFKLKDLTPAKIQPDDQPLYTADQLRAAIAQEREVSQRLRELLRRTQTYVCSNRELSGAAELCGEIAEAMAATRHLRAAIRGQAEGERG